VLLSGTWVENQATYSFANGRIYKQTFIGGNGLNYEYNFPTKGNSIFYVRIADQQGSNIIIAADMRNPANSHYVEARLPISMQSSGIVTGNKGYQYSGDELVMAMNQVYARELVHLPKSTLIAYANQLMLNREERETLLKTARQILGKQKPQNTPKPQQGSAGPENPAGNETRGEADNK
jgi:hypothetical protein